MQAEKKNIAPKTPVYFSDKNSMAKGLLCVHTSPLALH